MSNQHVHAYIENMPKIFVVNGKDHVPILLTYNQITGIPSDVPDGITVLVPSEVFLKVMVWAHDPDKKKKKPFLERKIMENEKPEALEPEIANDNAVCPDDADRAGEVAGDSLRSDDMPVPTPNAQMQANVTTEHDEYLCCHCDTRFSCAPTRPDIFCPMCNAVVSSPDPTMVHPANRPIEPMKAAEIIQWLGWRHFKLLFTDFCAQNPHLRPVVRRGTDAYIGHGLPVEP